MPLWNFYLELVWYITLVAWLAMIRWQSVHSTVAGLVFMLWADDDDDEVPTPVEEEETLDKDWLSCVNALLAPGLFRLLIFRRASEIALNNSKV